jgi:adenosylcobinamide-GDP ribazoletransferase
VIEAMRAAITMLTRLPASPASAEINGARAFGLVGAAIGLAGFIPLVVIGPAIAPGAAILAVAAMAILSGAVHLDGLADTADALLAIGPGAAERARKDPSIGAGGAAALILVIGLDVASLSAIVERSGALVAGLACLVGAASSRVAPVLVARAGRQPATAGGLGAWFIERTTDLDAALATSTVAGLAVAVAVAAGRVDLFAGGVVGLTIGAAAGIALSRWRGQLDGDGLGATVELTFAASVLTSAALARWPVG